MGSCDEEPRRGEMDGQKWESRSGRVRSWGEQGGEQRWEGTGQLVWQVRGRARGQCSRRHASGQGGECALQSDLGASRCALCAHRLKLGSLFGLEGIHVALLQHLGLLEAGGELLLV